MHDKVSQIWKTIALGLNGNVTLQWGLNICNENTQNFKKHVLDF